MNVTDMVSPGFTALAKPDIVKAIDLLSFLKMVITINAERVFFEVLVTRASAPALPSSLLKVTDSNRNDLL